MSYLHMEYTHIADMITQEKMALIRPCLLCRGGSWSGIARMPNGNMRTGAPWWNMRLDDE